jgi:membrane dipeptidase
VTTDSAGELLSRYPVFDGHNDLPWALRKAEAADFASTDLAAGLGFTHTDLPRLRAGRVGAQFWSVFVPAELAGEAALTATLEQIDLVHRMVAAWPDALELALTAADVRRIMASGRIASLLGAEGGHCINGSLGALRSLYRLGVRYMTLTHNRNVGWADSATDDPGCGGLSGFGIQVVREMQRTGMLADLSHAAPPTMRDALKAAQAPVIFSHSGALAICDHPRNVPDDVLTALAAGGGVCMITFVPAFVSQRCRDYELEYAAAMQRAGLDYNDTAQRGVIREEFEKQHRPPRATVAQVAEHAEHVRQVAGIDHVGVGGDFDGTDRLPDGLTDVSCYPALFAELMRRGWSDDDCAKMASQNILRVLAAAERFSASPGPRALR